MRKSSGIETESTGYNWFVAEVAIRDREIEPELHYFWLLFCFVDSTS